MSTAGTGLFRSVLRLSKEIFSAPAGEFAPKAAAVESGTAGPDTSAAAATETANMDSHRLVPRRIPAPRRIITD